MGFTSDACWFLLIKNDKKREAALNNEAGGDEKHVFFTWPYVNVALSNLVLFNFVYTDKIYFNP